MIVREETDDLKMCDSCIRERAPSRITYRGTRVSLCLKCLQGLEEAIGEYSNLDKKNSKDKLHEIIQWASEEDPNSVDKWLDYCAYYLGLFGWNSKAIRDFLDMGEGGGFNYDLLHIKTAIKTFYGEVHYCSDRMSLERLLRCHIQYRTLEKNA